MLMPFEEFKGYARDALPLPNDREQLLYTAFELSVQFSLEPGSQEIKNRFVTAFNNIREAWWKDVGSTSELPTPIFPDVEAIAEHLYDRTSQMPPGDLAELLAAHSRFVETIAITLGVEGQ